MTPEQEARFWKYVVVVESCWEWIGATGNGYGRFSVTRKHQVQAHRVSYEHYVGPIPVGMQIDHLCRNKLCVKPSHLETVTGRVNTLRGGGPSAINHLKTSCNKGHTRWSIRKGKYGPRRDCKECHRLRFLAKRLAQIDRELGKGDGTP